MAALYRKILLLLAFVSNLAALAQTHTVSGNVVDVNGDPIGGASLRLYAEKKTVAYGVTDSNGSFVLKYDFDAIDTLELSVSSLGYQKQVLKVPLNGGSLKIKLSEAPTELKEVVVKAPDVNQRGDTMSFNLNSFVSKRDITLEDGLKRLPGIEVSKSGIISYLGRNISNFLVEGLQLAGTRYNQITRNLPTQYVTKVEMIENFNEARVDSGRQSDNVAMNIRLSAKAKFKPVGSVEGAIGVRERDILYTLGGTGMMFTPSFQSMLTLKGSNMKEFSLPQTSGSLSSGATSATGKLSGDNPPLAASLYRGFNDHIVTLNTVKAFTQRHKLNANAFYAYSHDDYGYNSSLSYFTGEDSPAIVFAERYSPLSSTYRAGLNVDYSSDNSMAWFSNRCAFVHEYRRNFLDALISPGNDNEVLQSMRSRIFNFSDNIKLTLRKGQKRYVLTADFGYELTPVADIVISNSPEESLSGQQNADSHAFNAKITTSFDRLLTKNSSLNFPVSADLRIESINTLWNPVDIVNKAYGRKGSMMFRPNYELVTEKRKIELNVGIGIRMLFMSAGNRSTGDKQRLDRLFLSPLVRFRYQPNSRVSLAIRGSYDENSGDILDLLTNKVMQSFRQETVRSGIIARTSALSANLNVTYSDYISLWFADALLSASRNNLNVIGSTDVSAGQISSGAIAADNHTDSYSGNFGVSKHFRNIGLRVSLRGSAGVNMGQTVQQGERVDMTSTNLMLKTILLFSPVKLFELELEPSWNRVRSRYMNSGRISTMWNNEARLSVFPVEALELFAKVNCVSRHDLGNVYPTVSILDAGVNFTVKKFRFAVNANNLLNKRRYYYTVFNDLNTFVYDFQLRPRSVSFSLTVTL